MIIDGTTSIVTPVSISITAEVLKSSLVFMIPILTSFRPYQATKDNRHDDNGLSKFRKLRACMRDEHVSGLRRVPDRRRVGALLEDHGNLARHFDAELLHIGRRPTWGWNLNYACIVESVE